MKSAEDIIWELADGESDGWQTTYTFSDVIKCMKEYAKLAIEEQLVLVEQEAQADSPYHGVDEESIRNCTRVELK